MLRVPLIIGLEASISLDRWERDKLGAIKSCITLFAVGKTRRLVTLIDAPRCRLCDY